MIQASRMILNKSYGRLFVMKKTLVFIFFTFIIIVIVLSMFFGRKIEIQNIDINKPAEKIINVPNICQYPELPTGCESVAATMVLQYYGVNITSEEFAENWLECNGDFYSLNNELYGPDPNEAFAGNPFSENSYGCFASPIVNAINDNSTELNAKKIVNKSIEELCDEYIDNDKPILIWATMSMTESKKGTTWYLQDGSEFTWISGEHCLVLVGYSKDYYFLNDPQSGSTVAYQKDIVEERFTELGSQAVYIYEINKGMARD